MRRMSPRNRWLLIACIVAVAAPAGIYYGPLAREERLRAELSAEIAQLRGAVDQLRRDIGTPADGPALKKLTIRDRGTLFHQLRAIDYALIDIERGGHPLTAQDAAAWLSARAAAPLP